jgi:anaerobic selenocysteine-containing dehydrogenase
MIRGERVTWDECLDDIAGTVKRLSSEGGPDRVGFYIGMPGGAFDSTGRPFATKLMNALESRQLYSAATVDIAPLYRAAELVTGFAGVFPNWDLDEDDQPKVGIMFGFNPVVSHGYANIPHFPDPVRRIRGYRARGGELWVVDPRQTETAKLADHHLAIHPGTDAAVLAWLVRELLDHGADERELASACNSKDVAMLKAAVAEFDLDRVVALTGVASQELISLLGAIRSRGQVAVASGTGMTFGRHGIVAAWLCWALLIVTGSVDRPGGMRFTENMSDAALASPAPPEGLVGTGPASRPELKSVFGERPSAAIVDEIEALELRGLFVGGGNPLTAFPNPNRVRSALQQLELCVVVDAFKSEMTDLATHVLPATWHLERRDTFFWTRPMYSPPVFMAGAERKPTWWMYGQIAKRLGLDLFDGSLDVDTCSEASVFRHLHAARPNLEEVFAAGPRGIDVESVHGWVHEKVLPGGRWRLAPQVLVDRLPDIWQRDDSLRLVAGRRVRSLNSVAYASGADGHFDRPPIEISVGDAEAHQIFDGDLVRVTSTRGHVDGIAHIDNRLRSGVVSITHGWSEQNVGNLTDETRIDPLTGQPEQTDFPVTIELLGRHDE